MGKDIRDFVDVLQDLDGGSIIEEATHQLRQVVRSARIAGKKGTLTIKLDIEPDGRQLIVTPKVDAKCPIPATPMTLFFADDDGDLVKSDPKQEPLRGLDKQPDRPLRTIPSIDSHKGA